ncbi:hypothetical protein [Inhella crocodyli]|uniref:DUF2059 domain-containing protein n=1 Tax=Inhella crocodyli TaxID=2499851 RepID=A0A3S2U9K3_9BURK|nr:hypothetical protein [Inhella crocodyli]RVT82423.1 hypothetical protein EOD73_16965 [Inhella crocodyli]
MSIAKCTSAVSAALVIVTMPVNAATNLVDGLAAVYKSGPARVVAYCKEASPESHAELETEFVSMNRRMAEAVEPILAANASELDSVSEKEAAALEAFAEELGNRMLQAAKSYDPHKYCKWLSTSLRGTTVEKLRATIQQSMDRYAEKAKRSVTQSGARE